MAEIVSFPPGADEDEADVNERLAAIVDSSFDAIISKDLNSIIKSWNGAAERLFGYSKEEAIGRSILMLIPPHLQQEEDEIIARVRAGERIESFETTRYRKDGTAVSISLTVSPVRNRRGQIVGASKIARDITAAKENERRIRLLMREVNHRTKNQFAIILSIIRETKNRCTSPEEFERRVRERVTALSRSHDLLVAGDWTGTSLFDLVQEHLKAFGHEDQVTLSGPLLVLHPRAVQDLGMAMHELATNSAKYGALSGMEGRVWVTWRILEPMGEGRQFEFEWRETSVPRAEPPPRAGSRKGFGTIVLQRVAPQSLGGSATIEKGPGHFRWRLVAPMKGIDPHLE